MPLEIEPTQRTTDVRITALFGCAKVRMLTTGSAHGRSAIQGELDAVLLGCIHESSLIGYQMDSEAGYIYSGISRDFEIIIKTWPEFGTAHIFLDVTHSDVAFAKAVMDLAVTRLAEFYGAGRTQLITEIPVFFKDPVVCNDSPK